MLSEKNSQHVHGAAEGTWNVPTPAARHVVFHRHNPLVLALIELAGYQRDEIGGHGLVLHPVKGVVRVHSGQFPVGEHLPAGGNGDQHFGGGLVVGKVVAGEPVAIVAAGGIAVGPDLFGAVGMEFIGEDEE